MRILLFNIINFQNLTSGIIYNIIVYIINISDIHITYNDTSFLIYINILYVVRSYTYINDLHTNYPISKLYYIIIDGLCIYVINKFTFITECFKYVYELEDLSSCDNYVIDNIIIRSHLNIDVNNKYLLIVEGSDEIGPNGFIASLAGLYPILNNFDIKAFKEIKSRNEFISLAEKYKLVIHLKDKEFLPHHISDERNKKMSKNINKIYEICFELPSIESFFILDYFLKENKSEVIERINKYFKCKKTKKDYLSGLLHEVKENKSYIPYGNSMWDEALNELNEEYPNYEKIISVIRGHSWFRMFKCLDKNMKSTKKMINKTNFKKFHREIKNSLNITMNYIEELFYIHNANY